MHYRLNLDNCSLKPFNMTSSKKVSENYIDNLYDKNKIIINYQK